MSFNLRLSLVTSTTAIYRLKKRQHHNPLIHRLIGRRNARWVITGNHCRKLWPALEYLIAILGFCANGFITSYTFNRRPIHNSSLYLTHTYYTHWARSYQSWVQILWFKQVYVYSAVVI